ncbi:MAG: 3-phosphoshikimate 1-carboxyvinyltransferase [Pseudomonadota bacterium]
MFGAIAEGRSQIEGVLLGEDCLATADALRALGVTITAGAAGQFTVDGVGLHGLQPSTTPLDFGNSGTGMRLMCGLLAAQRFASVLVGDASLSRRPMLRVTDPLTRMGAHIETTAGHAPLRITPGRGLAGIRYELPVASAQLKSALLIAGLYADSATTLLPGPPSRDHTERMLAAMGAEVEMTSTTVSIRPASRLAPLSLKVPADLSSAAFLLVAASIVPGSEVTLPGVGLNPSRDGVLTILDRMGADIQRVDERIESGEPVADLVVRARALQGADIPAALVPLAIDEFPVLFVAAAAASGRSHFSGLAELRHKETDRISAMTRGLAALGISVEEGPDWVTIEGGTVNGGRIDSEDDHRIAMSFAVAGAIAEGPVEIEKPENIATSFPGFVALANACGLSLALSET